MTHITRRTTKAGSLSTALVQSYRDEQGRPRQRLLANLHGETDLLRALAKLAALREALRKERAEPSEALEKFDEIVCARPIEELDGIVRARDRTMDWLKKIDNELAAIQKDGVVIKRHCDATPEKIQAAIKTFKKELHDAEYLVKWRAFLARQKLDEAKATLRRLSH